MTPPLRTTSKKPSAGSRRLLATSVWVALASLVVACGAEESDGDGPDAESRSEPPGLQLVAIGDSIPYNAPTDCPGCTGFVESYAAQVEEATGQAVQVTNRSEHTGLQVEGLVASLDASADHLREADVILVGIAHNSTELASDMPCGAPLGANDLPEWSEVDRQCAVAAAKKYRPVFAKLFADVAALREGSPTILRAVNRYNDFLGWEEGNLTPGEDRRTKVVLDAWNGMLCETATSAGFGCADIYAAFNGPDGLDPSGELLANDYTHPSQKGNDLITSVLTEMGFEPLA